MVEVRTWYVPKCLPNFRSDDSVVVGSNSHALYGFCLYVEIVNCVESSICLTAWVNVAMLHFYWNMAWAAGNNRTGPTF